MRHDSARIKVYIYILLILLLGVMGFYDLSGLISRRPDCPSGLKCEPAPNKQPNEHNEIISTLPAADSQAGYVLDTTVQVPGPKNPGTPPWYANPFYNGNLRLVMDLPFTGMSLVYNSVRCNVGWRLSIDWVLNAVSSSELLLSNGEGKVSRFTATSGGTGTTQWVSSNPMFQPVILTYDGSTKYTAHLTDGTKFVFTQKGSSNLYILSSTKDRNENETRYDRSSPTATIITDPQGNIITVQRGSDDKVIGITGLNAEVFKFSYDAYGRLYNLQYPDGQEYKIVNFTDGNIASRGSPALSKYCLVTSFTAPTKKPLSFGYYADGVTKEIIGASTGSLEYTPTTVKFTANGEELLDTYDSLGMLESTQVGALTTSYTWDPDKNPTQIAAPYGQTSTYTYEDGKLKTQLDPNGSLTNFSYGTDGLLNQIQKVSTTYHLKGLEGYPNLRLVSEITEPTGRTQKFVYDNRGNLKEKYYGPRLAATYSYSARGRMTAMNTSDGSTTYAYDSKDNLISSTDPQGRITTYQSSAAGIPQRETSAFGFETVYDRPNKWGIPGRVTTYALKTSAAPLPIRTDISVFNYDGSTNAATVSESSYTRICSEPVATSSTSTSSSSKAPTKF